MKQILVEPAPRLEILDVSLLVVEQAVAVIVSVNALMHNLPSVSVSVLIFLGLHFVLYIHHLLLTFLVINLI